MKKLVAILSVILTITSSSFTFAAEKSDEYEAFDQLAGYISEYYIDDTLTKEEVIKTALSEYLKNDDEKLIELLKTMFASLDPYSEFYTAEDYLGFVNELNRTFYGIGVKIDIREEYVTVTGFTEDSPAEKVGVQIGDKISKVDGVDMKGRPIEEVQQAILGELGTSVSITFLRGDTELTYTIIRGEVNESTVGYEKLADDVAYINILDMSNHTASEFAEALASADADGITDIILDLRNNVGGYLDCAIDIAKMIVPEGKIIDTVYRQADLNKSYYSELKETKYKFNVLVNDYTASAAEILASAIQESGAGKLIGEKTYG